MKYKKSLVASLAVLGLLVLAACGQSSDSKTKDSSTANTEKTAKAKDTFTYVISGDPTSMNPITVSDRWGLTVTNMIYSPLVRIEPDGSAHNELAESVEPAADGLSLVVKLKKDIKWSDGQPLTADDVVFTYEEKAKRENGASDALWIGDKPITVSKVDDLTVKFTLPEKSVSALNNLTAEIYIIPEHVYKDVKDFSTDELSVQPVGSGPYKLVTYKKGEYLQFEANDSYFGGKPSIKNVTLRIVTSADTTKIALQKGEVDASFILPSDTKDLENSKNLKTYEYSENRVGYIGVNANSLKLQDVKVRQALFFALDRNELNKGAYLSDKYYENAYSILPPANKFATTDLEKYEQDTKKSESLLKEANATNVSINLAYSSSDPAQTIQATLIQQQLQQVGVKVELVGLDPTALYAELQKPDSTKFDFFLGGYIMGNDPDQYSPLFQSTGSANYFHYKNPAVDELFKSGAVELDEAKRKDIYNDLQKTIANDAIFFPIVDNKKVMAVNTDITDVEKAKLIPIYSFQDWSKLKIK